MISFYGKKRWRHLMTAAAIPFMSTFGEAATVPIKAELRFVYYPGNTPISGTSCKDFDFKWRRLECYHEISESKLKPFEPFVYQDQPAYLDNSDLLLDTAHSDSEDGYNLNQVKIYDLRLIKDPNSPQIEFMVKIYWQSRYSKPNDGTIIVNGSLAPGVDGKPTEKINWIGFADSQDIEARGRNVNFSRVSKGNNMEDHLKMIQRGLSDDYRDESKEFQQRTVDILIYGFLKSYLRNYVPKHIDLNKINVRDGQPLKMLP